MGYCIVRDLYPIGMAFGSQCRIRGIMCLKGLFPIGVAFGG